MGAHEEGSRRKTTVVMDSVVCPKPRRLNDQIRPLRVPFNSDQAEMGDEEAGAEILDIILTKVGYVGEKPGYQVASSPPPLYCGSPPSRASNPITQDANFVNGKITQLSLADLVSPSPGSSLASECQGQGGGVRVKYRNMPAAVRIEGFDCLSLDMRHCSISAMA